MAGVSGLQLDFTFLPSAFDLTSAASRGLATASHDLSSFSQAAAQKATQLGQSAVQAAKGAATSVQSVAAKASKLGEDGMASVAHQKIASLQKTADTHIHDAVMSAGAAIH